MTTHDRIHAAHTAYRQAIGTNQELPALFALYRVVDDARFRAELERLSKEQKARP